VGEKEMLRLAASAERPSEHPLAGAVVHKAQEQGLFLENADKFEARPEKGVLAQVEGRFVVAGNGMFFTDVSIEIISNLLEKASSYKEQGKTAMLIVLDGQARGVLVISDRLKESAQQALSDLQMMNLSVVMITGDNARSAAAVVGMLGIKEVLPEVLPEDKSNEVKRLQQNGSRVAFVGDGINDAPALVQVDVGIAIVSCTDVAIGTGEIVLMKDNLLHVVAAIQLSRKVISCIKLNIFWAFAYNVTLVPVAAVALYQTFGITFRPELAGLAMAPAM
jgi:P-type Cu+ transporter